MARPTLKPITSIADGVIQLKSQVIGIPLGVVDFFEEILTLYEAGLAPNDRPLANVFLCGPTGVGKTLTFERLAQHIHGSERSLLRVDCGEFQNEHEVAKLIGAPPGYLGHRETTPMFTQQKLNAVTSERSNLSIVVFDEIEKASASLHRLLLGVLDKGILRLGDNTTVNFERSIIGLTSNIGGRFFTRESMGLIKSADYKDAKRATDAGLRKAFTPEFLNRLDYVGIFNPLTEEEMGRILDLELTKLNLHIGNRWGSRKPKLVFTKASREWLAMRGFSKEYGARELKRLIQREVTVRIALTIDKEELKFDSDGSGFWMEETE